MCACQTVEPSVANPASLCSQWAPDSSPLYTGTVPLEEDRFRYSSRTVGGNGKVERIRGSGYMYKTRATGIDVYDTFLEGFPYKMEISCSFPFLISRVGNSWNSKGWRLLQGLRHKVPKLRRRRKKSSRVCMDRLLEELKLSRGGGKASQLRG